MTANTPTSELTVDPKDPVAYPHHPKRPEGFARKIHVIVEDLDNSAETQQQDHKVNAE